MSRKISRAAYADRLGPTTGDKVRLADTGLCEAYGSRLEPKVRPTFAEE